MDISFKEEDDTNLLILLNNLFYTTITSKFEEIHDLSNEDKVYEIIKEIDSKIEQNHGKIEIIKNEKITFIAKYLNFSSIFKCIGHFLEYYPEKEKILLTKEEMTNKLSIKDIIHEDREQLVIIGELLLVLGALSSKKDTYLETVLKLNEECQYTYIEILEKYINLEDLDKSRDDISQNKSQISILSEDNEDKNIIQKINNRRSSIMNIKGKASAFSRKSLVDQKYIKKLQEIENDKNGFIKCVESEIVDLVSNLQEKTRELESAKKKIEELTHHYQEKDNGVTTQVIDYNSVSGSENPSEMSNQEDIAKNEELRIKFENERMKWLHEMELIREKEKSSEDLNEQVKILREVNRKLTKTVEKTSNHEMIVNENEYLQNTIENLRAEIANHKHVYDFLKKEMSASVEKYKIIDKEKKLLEEEVIKLKGNIENLEDTIRKTKRNSIPKRHTIFEGIVLSELHQEDVKDEIQEVNEDSMTSESKKSENSEEREKFQKDYLELIKISSSQTGRITKMIDEKELLTVELEKVKTDLELAIHEQKELKLENENLSLRMNLYEKENENIANTSEKLMIENSNLTQEINNLSSKLKLISFEKETLYKDNTYLAVTFEKNKKFIDKLQNDIKIIFQTNQKLQLENDRLNENIQELNEKAKSDKIYQLDQGDSSKDDEFKEILAELERLKKENVEINGLKLQLNYLKKENSEFNHFKVDFNNLKNEVSSLKLTISQKEEFIKLLNSRQNQLEAENKKILQNFENSNEKHELEIRRKNQEIEELQKIIKEQNNLVDEEHEILANSLFEMSNQFINYRNQLLNNNTC